MRTWLAAGVIFGCLACGKEDAKEEGFACEAMPAEGGARTSCGGREEQLTCGEPLHKEGDLRYADPPPAGGPHSACWAEWAAYTAPAADELWVHNLEHGGIVFLYNCPGASCAKEVESMTAFVEGHERAILTPYPALKTRFAVVSWGYRLQSDCYDEGVFQAFYSTHFNRARENVADGPPANCY